MGKDNTTLAEKVKLRRSLLAKIDKPVIGETHGGHGVVFLKCYFLVKQGMVIDKQPAKTDTLVIQRPTWSVYEGDCNPMIAAGVGSHLPINLWDIDPYGSAWDTIDAIFESYQNGTRPIPPKFYMVVNDALRQKVMLKGAWTVKQLAEVVKSYGNDGIFRHYLAICNEMLTAKAGAINLKVTDFQGYYCGDKQAVTHYAVTIEQ